MDLLSGYDSSDSSDAAAGGKNVAAAAETSAAAAASTSFTKPSPLPQPPTPPLIAATSSVRRQNAAPQPSFLASSSIRQARQTAGTTTSTALTIAGRGRVSAPAAVSGRGGGGGALLMNNPLKSVLHAPVQGPSSIDPHSSGGGGLARGVAGAAEADVAFDDEAFKRERASFQRTGRAIGPDARGTVVERGTLGHGRSGVGGGVETEENTKKRSLGAAEKDEDDGPPSTEEEGRGSRRRRRKKDKEDDARILDDEDERYGIWAPPSSEERAATLDTLTEVATKGIESLSAEQLAEREHLAERDRRRGKVAGGEEGEEESRENRDFDRLVERKMSHLLPPRMDGEEPTAIEPKTTYHGGETVPEVDYRGRSWIVPPSGSTSVEPGEVDHHQCYVPKKVVHRFTGHSKGVHRIRLFPRTGHLLLSAGLDGKCKVWSVPRRRVLRTYIGHSAAVRDVQFNLDGSKFVSASFDRFLRLWDTASGSVLGTYTNRRVPYVVKFYPHDDNIFVVGCSDNKIVAYDSTTSEITQEYDHHLAPVNAILFVEDRGTKMITSSDDKKVLVWEWDIGVPIKYISDPTMHSMPVMTLHPTASHFVGQSLDNRIVVYGASDRYRLERKKKFDGHQIAGYACDIDFSPDGRFVCSGDGDGKVYFWEWRRHKLLQKYRAHDDGPCIGCAWHPVEPSTVFTCGWDGVIKMWQ